MSQPDFGKLILIIHDWVKLDNSILVTFNCRYLEEDTLITPMAIPIVDNKKQDYYMRQAFKAAKKEIKQWVRTVHGKPSVVGSQYVFALNELNDPDDIVQP